MIGGVVYAVLGVLSLQNNTVVPGIISFVSSLGLLALGEFMLLSVNVATDVELSRRNQLAILQFLESPNRDRRWSHNRAQLPANCEQGVDVAAEIAQSSYGNDL